MGADGSEGADVGEVQGLLEAAGIRYVYAVDDEFAADLEEVTEACLALSRAQLAELPHVGDLIAESQSEVPEALLRSRLRGRWKELEASERSTLASEARSRAGHVDTQGQPEAGELEGIFSGPAAEFRAMSLHEWREEGETILEREESAGKLIIFDRDMSQEGADRDEGVRLAAEVLGRESGSIWCGILTHTVQQGAEKTLREALASRGITEPERVVVASKQELGGDEDSFAPILKAMLLGPAFSQLRRAVRVAIDESSQEAHRRLDDLDIYEFERIVFASSQREGLWEPDTLLRVYAIFQRDEVRKRVRRKPEVVESVSFVRKLMEVSSRGQSAGEERARRLQRMEIVEPGEYINGLHFPVEAGDVFRKANGNAEYVLVEQPCDLMVRNDGKRSPERSSFTLLRLRDRPPDRRGSLEIPFYYPDGSSAYVDLGDMEHAPAIALDCCAFNSDGASRLTLAIEARDYLPIPWVERLRRLQSTLEKTLDGLGDVSSDRVRKYYLAGWFSYLADGPFKATVQSKENMVTFNVERVHRLHYPRARALLVAFNNYRARDAFEGVLV